MRAIPSPTMIQCWSEIDTLTKFCIARILVFTPQANFFFSVGAWRLVGKVDFIIGKNRRDFWPPPQQAQAGHFSCAVRLTPALLSPPISNLALSVGRRSSFCRAFSAAVQPTAVHPSSPALQLGARVSGDDTRPESAGAAAQRGRSGPIQQRCAQTADACRQRSTVAFGRASRVCLAVWVVAVRGCSLVRTCAHAAPHSRCAEARVVARRVRAAIATCQRICPRASSGCTITYAC